MTLFHGGLVAVENPRIWSQATYRPLDFGAGFYTTTSRDQASRWVRNWLDRDPSVKRNPEHGYDIVTGPVANDRVYTVILQYEAGFLTEEEAVARLKPYRLAGQVLFYTERSLSFLKKVSTAEVSR